MDYSTIEKFQTWLHDAQRYTEENIVRLPSRNTIRLLVIIGAYCLLRPLLLKYAGVKQEQDFEKLLNEGRNSSAATQTSDASKEPVDVLEAGQSDTDDEDAAVRRRRPLQDIVEGKDRLPSDAEANSDQEIEQFLRKVIK